MAAIGTTRGMKIAPPARPPAQAAATTEAAPRAAAAARRRFAALWAAAVLVPALGFALAAWSAWSDTQAEAASRLLRMVDVPHEHALRAFQTQEVVLAAVEGRIEGLSWPEIRDSAGAHGFLRRLEASSGFIYGLALVAPDGRLAAAGRAAHPAPAIDLNDRDYVRAHRAGEAGLHVSRIIVTRPSGARVFALSRGRLGPDGRPDGGTIATSFEPEGFAAFYASVAEGPHDVQALLRADGAILARNPEPPPGTDWGPPPANPLTRAMRAAAPGGRGGLRVEGGLDGRPKRLAFRRVGGYPAFVVYGLTDESVRAAWLRRLPPIAAVSALGSLLLLSLTALARRAVGREAAALAAAAAEAAHARAEAEARVEAEARLRQAEKVGALGQVAAGVAHDFNNLVQAVSAAAHLLGRRAGDRAEVLRLAAMLRDAAERGARVVHRMLDYVRREAGGDGGDRFEPLPALRRLEALLGGHLRPGVALRLDLPTALPPVQGDRAEFETVLVNLVGNARDAMPEGRGGEVRVAAAAVAVAEGQDSALSPGRYLRVTVADTGTGMPPEVLARVGEPFFTTKPAGKGTGLGLSLARRFAERAGGVLRLASRPGEGTTVTLWLREAPPPPQDAGLPGPPPERAAGAVGPT